MTDKEPGPCGKCADFEPFESSVTQGRCTRPFGSYSWVDVDEVKEIARCFTPTETVE